MLSQECLHELKASWLPNITDAGLARLVDLLDKGSPLPDSRQFHRSVPMGCLATHAGWHHPQTARMTLDAGICWLHNVAGLNPATSLVIREWDRAADCDYQIRRDLAAAFRDEIERRSQLESEAVDSLADLVCA